MLKKKIAAIPRKPAVTGTPLIDYDDVKQDIENVIRYVQDGLGLVECKSYRDLDLFLSRYSSTDMGEVYPEERVAEIKEEIKEENGKVSAKDVINSILESYVLYNIEYIIETEILDGYFDNWDRDFDHDNKDVTEVKYISNLRDQLKTVERIRIFFNKKKIVRDNFQLMLRSILN